MVFGKVCVARPTDLIAYREFLRLRPVLERLYAPVSLGQWLMMYDLQVVRSRSPRDELHFPRRRSMAPVQIGTVASVLTLAVEKYIFVDKNKKCSNVTTRSTQRKQCTSHCVVVQHYNPTQKSKRAFLCTFLNCSMLLSHVLSDSFRVGNN